MITTYMLNLPQILIAMVFTLQKTHEDVMHGVSKLDIEGCRYIVSMFQRYSDEAVENRRLDWLKQGQSKLNILHQGFTCLVIKFLFYPKFYCCSHQLDDERDTFSETQSKYNDCWSHEASQVYLMMAQNLQKYIE